MKIHVEQKEIKKALDDLHRCVNGANLFVAIETKEGRVELSSYDENTGVRIRIAGDIESEGAIYLPLDVVRNTVASFSQRVTVELKTKVQFSSGKLKVSFPPHVREERVRIPSFDTVQPLLTVHSDTLKQCIHFVGHVAATSKEQPGRIYAQAIAFVPADGHVDVFATDISSAAHVRIDGLHNLSSEVLVLARDLSAFALSLDKSVLVHLSVDPHTKNISLVSDAILMYTRGIHSGLIRYDKMYPHSYTYEATFHPDELLSFCRAALSIGIEEAVFSFSEQEVQVRANNEETCIETSFPVSGSGESRDMRMKLRYLTENISRLSDKQVIIRNDEKQGAVALFIEGAGVKYAIARMR